MIVYIGSRPPAAGLALAGEGEVFSDDGEAISAVEIFCQVSEHVCGYLDDSVTVATYQVAVGSVAEMEGSRAVVEVYVADHGKVFEGGQGPVDGGAGHVR